MKLNEQGYNILKDELNKNEEMSFSKTSNVMLAIDLMAQGEEITSTQVTKANLANIIKILCKKLKLTEESEENIEIEAKKDSNDSTNQIEENEKINSDVTDVTKSSQKTRSETTCRYYKAGKCRHGKSGKTKDENGKSCDFLHPPICRKYESYGFKENGCRDRKCPKLHMNICKIFMRHQNCKYGNSCKFFHPKRLKNVNEIKKLPSSQTHKKDVFSYAQIVKNPYKPQSQQIEHSPFLGQTQQFQLPVINQENQFNHPMLPQRAPTQQDFLELQTGQKQMMNIFLSMNQKLKNLEKSKMQMLSM